MKLPIPEETAHVHPGEKSGSGTVLIDQDITLTATSFQSVTGEGGASEQVQWSSFRSAAVGPLFVSCSS